MRASVGGVLSTLFSPVIIVALAQGGGGPPRYAEYRADAIVGRGTAAQAGGGVSVPLGVYVRLAIDGAAGATWRDATTRASGRVDAIGRFLLDPFREVPVALSLGGGVSVPYVDGESRVRPYLVLVVDIEGRTRGPITPALQLGLGGGARVGLVLRTATGRWR
jgi:hypothetical protein